MSKPKRHGIAVGKFYPPHEGHHYLLDTALSECDLVTVAVCWSSVETISAEQRIEWLKDRHGTYNIEYIAVHDDTPVLYTDETWEWFLEALMKALDDRWSPYDIEDVSYPNVIYSGESYATEFGERLLERYDRRAFREAFPNKIDVRILNRAVVGTSASNFRNDPVGNWEQLSPAVKAGLCKRVVICGGESTGTTTLAKDLADYFKTTCVPEYGRHFDWAVGKHHEWKPEDFNHIAEMQKLWEDKLARETHGGLLICDTDEFATEMFSYIYTGDGNWGVMEAAKATPADLYIITDHVGVEFEDDGTRFNSGKREWSTQWLRANLPRPWVIATGSREKRVEWAVNALDQILEWDIATPLEYREDQTV